MDLLLNIATILGGAAALWYLGQQFLALRERMKLRRLEESPQSSDLTAQITPRRPDRVKPSTSDVKSRKVLPRALFMLIGAGLNSLGGIVVGLSYYYWGFKGGLFMWFPFLAISLPIANWLHRIGLDRISETVSFSALFMLVWAVIGFVLSAIIHYLNGGSFPMENSPFLFSKIGLQFTLTVGILGGMIGFFLERK